VRAITQRGLHGASRMKSPEPRLASMSRYRAPMPG
jgi:hypothetical protein